MKKFYITTPIYYVNDVATIGHAYTTIAADVLARWHRLKGDKVFFLTGLDENSQNTDDMAEKWKKVWKVLNISNDDFIRTTEERHKEVVNEFFSKVYKKGDIYKGNYEGLYCEGCEDFIKESELIQGKCQFHKKEPKRITEENYFFRLSKYEKLLLNYISKNPDFIGPQSRKNEVISFIKQGLIDISISRSDKEWGIKLPIDNRHVYWTWFDALVNYISGAEKYWPADLQLMAKDIIKFHGIIWIAMLMSAGYELPKNIFAHGFLTVNGQKMSKSLGNAINPLYLADKYGTDSIRYFLLREIPFGQDGDFSEKALVDRHNGELANELGNLVSRALSMVEKYFQGIVPKGKNILTLNTKPVFEAVEKYELHVTLQEIWRLIGIVNKYINDSKPWESTNKEEILYSVLDSLRQITILISPFIPETADKINAQLGIKLGNFKDLKNNLLKSGSKVNKSGILFAKLE